MANINDPKSLTGIYARGKTRYVNGSPNPSGKNQYLSKLAKIRRLRNNSLKGRV